MKNVLLIFALACVATVGWRVGSVLSSDAIGMALGVLFGIMAGIPAALIVIATREQESHKSQPLPTPPPPSHGPVIVVNNYSLTVSPLDERLQYTGMVTQDGYHLMHSGVGIRASEMAKKHEGYSVARHGQYLGFKPLSIEAKEQLEQLNTTTKVNHMY